MLKKKGRSAVLEMISDYTKYIALFLGIAAGLPIVWQRRKLLGQKNILQVILICLAFSVCSTVSAMVFAGVEGVISGEGFGMGAVSTYGVYLICPFMLAVLAKVLKIKMSDMFGVFALYALPSLFFLRCNCLISGCCTGKEIFDTGLNWPTREAELVFYTVMLIVLLKREKKETTKGTAFPLLMISYGGFRFIEEWFRTAPGAGVIHLAHIWSMITVVIGLSIYFELKSSSRTNRGGRYV